MMESGCAAVRGRSRAAAVQTGLMPQATPVGDNAGCHNAGCGGQARPAGRGPKAVGATSADRRRSAAQSVTQ